MMDDQTPTSPALVASLEQTTLDNEDGCSPHAQATADMTVQSPPNPQPDTLDQTDHVEDHSQEPSRQDSPAAATPVDHGDAVREEPPQDTDETSRHRDDNETPESSALNLHKNPCEQTEASPLDPSASDDTDQAQCFRPAILHDEGSQPCDVPLQLTNRPDNHMPEDMCSSDGLQRDELNLAMPMDQEPQNLSQSPGMCADDLQRHLMEDQSSLLDQPENLHQHHLQQHHYSQQHCHMQQYQQHLQKMVAHGQMPSHLRGLHEYDDSSPHPHLLGEQRHLPDGMSDHPHLHNDRPHDGYWNMPLGGISKVKSEAKDWYEDNEDMMSDSLSGTGTLKGDPHSAYYRTSPHSNMSAAADMLVGQRPPSMPHGGIPFSQTEHRLYHQPYTNHLGMRDIPPMSPGYPNHPNHQRPSMPTSQHHATSQHSASQHFNMHNANQMNALQQQQPQPPPHQHLQQQYSNQPQYGNQQSLASHGQQIPSPYHQSLAGHLAPPGMAAPGSHEVREGRSDRDPYNFVDEYTGPPSRPVDEILGQQPKRRGRKPKHIKLMETGGDPLAIAQAQAAHEAKKRKWRQTGPDGKQMPVAPKPRKRPDRYDGMPEDELSRKILPDHLTANLDIVIISKFPFQIGINPGLFAAYKGHHYAGPGKCLYLSGLIPEALSSEDDSQLLEHGIGFTNIVSRTTRGSAELTRKEIKEGGQLLLSKLQKFQPRVAVFNGKGIYEIFSGKKEFSFGRQPEKIEGTHTHVWVMPSSSARCAQLPRALDKVPFYTALRKFRDFLNGTLTELTEEEVTFTTKAKSIKIECDKLDPTMLGESMGENFLDEAVLNDSCETEMDSDEISRSISQSLFNLSGVTREELEKMDCATIPIRKKRGRPKKTPEDPNAPPRPKPRPIPTDMLMLNGEEPPRKKRGRPKKVLEDGSIPPPKRPGRKPKALKEMLAVQQINPQNVHQGMSLNPLNGMMPPSGYSSTAGAPPFPSHYGSTALHSMNGPPIPGVSPVNSLPGMNMSSTRGLPSMTNSMGAGPLPSMHGGSLQPPRGNTPKPYGHSPGYSPGPGSVSHQQIGQPYSHPSDKSDLQSLDDHDLGLSPPPCASPGMVQPDFEPPTSLPESESLAPSDLSTRGMSNHQDESHLARQSQFSNPGTPVDDSAYVNYQSYSTGKPCSPNYSSSVPIDPSSYSRTVSQSPGYAGNTQSPCHPSIAQSPSYPANVNSPSYHRNPPSVSRSPSYASASNQSPSFLPTTTQSPSYHPALSQSPSCSSITRSPSYPSSLTHSPSYPPNHTHSPSYRPPMSHSPSFSSNATHSPSLNKPHPPTGHTPKGDVSSKSISGLESLVDQIPSLSNDGGDSGGGANLTNAASSSNGAAPFSPPQPAAAYQAFQGPTTNTPYGSHYGSPQAAHQYSPHYTAGGTNHSTNFSVSSLANSSITTSLSYSSGFDGEASSITTAANVPSNNCNSLSVSSLTGDAPAPPVPSMYNNGTSYSPLPLAAVSHSYQDLLNPSILPPTPSIAPGFMGSSLLPGGMPSSMGGGLHSPMNMSGSQLGYPYQYGESSPAYSTPAHGFPYSPAGSGFHLTPRFPYPTSYGGGPYSQGYPQSAVHERIKHTGMGFGTF